MKIIPVLAVAAGAGYLYKRFFAQSGAGIAETQAAEPFSSEQLDDVPDQPTEPESAAVAEPARDTLERPTWLDPADAAG